MGANSNAVTLTERLVFGAALEEAMMMRNIGQTELAKLVGTNQGQVSQWVYGKYAPVPRTVFQIEEALGLPPGWLSQHFDYYPRTALARTETDIDTAVMECKEFSGTERQAILAVMNSFRAMRAKHQAETSEAKAKAGTERALDSQAGVA